jgi:predicted small metal-binding protein
MTKSISCADAGKDCGWSATAETEEELMNKVAEHAKAEHKDMEITPEVVAKIKSIIKEI